MRPNMGKGVSIPSQLRWIGYTDRWAKHGKIYVERQVEVLEVHCWGLRDGVKIQVEGFVNDGKLIKRFHTFTRGEREVVRGEVTTTSISQAVQEVMYKNGVGWSAGKKTSKVKESVESDGTAFERANAKPGDKESSGDDTSSSKEETENDDTGTGDVIFRPSTRVVLPSNDINIDIERRNKAAFDLTMVTAVAHVWFNCYFEGNGPEQKGIADESGVFEITWDAMDGIKGSARKGTQAFEKIAVVWKALRAEEGRPGIVITEPREGEDVKQSSPADWKGQEGVEPSEGKDLGLRISSPSASNTNVSKASSVKSQNADDTQQVLTKPARDSQESETRGLKVHGPNGEDVVQEPNSGSADGSGPASFSSPTLPSQLDGTEQSKASSDAGQRMQSPESHKGGVEGILPHVSTGDLPDGRPEDEMKTAKEHALGHLGKHKTTSS